MNVVIVHGYAHRLNEFGIVESAPVKTISGGVGLMDSDWQQRSEDSMDMLGGDMDLVRSDLERYSHVFRSEGGERVPRAESGVHADNSIGEVKVF